MEKILLIDDEEDIVRVLSMSLKSDGYDVVSAYLKKNLPISSLRILRCPVWTA